MSIHNERKIEKKRPSSLLASRSSEQILLDQKRLHPSGKKDCGTCGSKQLPLSQFYSHIRNPDGLHSVCKKCDRKKRKRNAEKNKKENHKRRKLAERDKCVVISPSMKECSTCKIGRSVEDFPRDSTAFSDRHSQCRFCKRRKQLPIIAERIRFKKENPCATCGFADFRALDLAHRDRDLKRRVRKPDGTPGRTVGPSRLQSLKSLRKELPNLYSSCRACHRLDTKKENADRRDEAKIADYKRKLSFLDPVNNEKLRRGSCLDCKRQVTPDNCCSFDFDHRVGVEKIGNVSSLAHAGESIQVVKAEWEKCDLRCTNCHAIVTYERQQPGRCQFWADELVSTALYFATTELASEQSSGK